MTDAHRRGAAVLAVCTMLGACVRGSLPPREFYRLAIPDPGAAPSGGASGSGLLAGPLTIVPYETPGIYAGPGIVYRIDSAEYGVYPSREWAIPLSDMLVLATERMLRAMPLTSEPAIIGSSRRSRAYEWRATVREFEEVDRGRRVFAAVAIDAQIVRARDDSVLWSGSAGDEREVAAPRMRDVVDALAASTTEVLRLLLTDSQRALRASTAAAAPLPP